MTSSCILLCPGGVLHRVVPVRDADHPPHPRGVPKRCMVGNQVLPQPWLLPAYRFQGKLEPFSIQSYPVCSRAARGVWYMTSNRRAPPFCDWLLLNIRLDCLKSHCIAGSCDRWEFPPFCKGHWQSPCIALREGKFCLPLGLCKGNVKEHNFQFMPQQGLSQWEKTSQV